MKLSEIIRTEAPTQEDHEGITDRRRRMSERQERLKAQVEEARKKYLSEEDQMLARVFHLPKARKDRVEAANKLRTGPGGRKRSINQIAAIMGVTYTGAKGYFDNPEKAVGSTKALKGGRRIGPREKANKLRLETAIPTDRESMGAKIKRRRKTRAITQVKLAEAMDVDREQLQAWERGDPEPPIGVFVQVMALLDAIA